MKIQFNKIRRGKISHKTFAMLLSFIMIFTVMASSFASSSVFAEDSKPYITLSIDKRTIGKADPLNPTRVEFKEGESVWEVLEREMKDRNIDYEHSWTAKYNSIYLEWVDGDGEFDHGPGSGWMYSVDGWYPNYGASEHKLKGGEVVQWRYTTNLGADLGKDVSIWDDEEKKLEQERQDQLEKERQDKLEKERQDKLEKERQDKLEKERQDELEKERQDKLEKERQDKLERERQDELEKERQDKLEKEKQDKLEKETNIYKAYNDELAISSWAKEGIKQATEKGFVAGHNGNFRPKENITRAEFTKIMVSVLGLEINVSESNEFEDVNKSNWFHPYVAAATKAGIVKGYGDNFKPNDNITREQMASIIVRALNLQYIKANEVIKDIDKVSNWAKADVETAVTTGLVQGSNGNFNPKSQATREMAAVVAMRGLNYKQGDIVVPTPKPEPPTNKHIDLTNNIENTANFMKQTVTDPVVASIGGEWTVFGLARSNISVPEIYYDKYYSNLEKILTEKKGILHRIKYTEYDRVILALTSAGRGVTNVAGYNLLEPLADFDKLIVQGINGPVFALIALDSKNYEIPQVAGAKTQTTREMLVDFILDREITGGGWALGANAPVADADITGMAIQGLTPYYNTNPKVKKAVDRGITWLSREQKSDGGYHSWQASNSESISQVIVALTGLGIDPHNDSRFIKNGKSAVDALLEYRAENGGFYHIKSGEVGNGGANPGDIDLMATDQAMYAMIAYNRFVTGQNRLYDMTDVRK